MSILRVAKAGLVPLLALLLSGTALGQGQGAWDPLDPPGRVAYLSHVEGSLSYSPAGEDVWLDPSRNRPLVRGDRLWSAARARSELQIGSIALRLADETAIEILELSDQLTQVLLSQGSLSLRVRRLHNDENIEIATPSLAFVITRPGRYRIDVDDRDQRTSIVVWEGAGDVYGDRSDFPLRAGDAVTFYSADLRDYRLFALPRADAFDRYASDRDRRLERSASLRYVDDDVIGYSALDDYGSWRAVRNVGNVWFPSRVDAGWAPYRDGQWVWQEPWGWTWVDNAPWGFAPSHYGRWVSVSNRWGWIPGPRNVRSVYAPALVAFVGGSGWSLTISSGSVSPVGWFPLGPREVYVPSYRASRDYFDRVNISNTVVNTTIINNYYSGYRSGGSGLPQTDYANRRVAGALTVVPGNVFSQSRPVRQAALRVEGDALRGAEYSRFAPVAPSVRSVIGPGRVTSTQPEAQLFNRTVVARSAPPPAPVPFAGREAQLGRTPGQAPGRRAEAGRPARQAAAPANVRVMPARSGAINVRETDSRRAPAAAGSLPPLDRAAPARDAGPRSQRPGEAAPRQPSQSPPAPDAREREAADRRPAERRDPRDAVRVRPPAGPQQSISAPPQSPTAADVAAESRREQQLEQQRRQQEQVEQRQREADRRGGSPRQSAQPRPAEAPPAELPVAAPVEQVPIEAPNRADRDRPTARPEQRQDPITPARPPRATPAPAATPERPAPAKGRGRSADPLDEDEEGDDPPKGRKGDRERDDRQQGMTGPN